MKKTNKNIALTLIIMSLLIITCAIPVYADSSSYLDLRINGDTCDYSYYQNAAYNTPEWAIRLNPDYDRDQVVLLASLRNGYDEYRGDMEVYEGTSNHAGSNTVKFGYDYRIKGYRQYEWDDEFVTVQGRWDLN